MNFSEKVTIKTKKMPVSLRLLMRLLSIVGFLFVFGNILPSSSIVVILILGVLVFFIPVSWPILT